jgi:uncharacterized membrane protein
MHKVLLVVFCLIQLASTIYFFLILSFITGLNYDDQFTYNTALDHDPNLTSARVIQEVLRTSAVGLAGATVLAALLYALNIALWEEHHEFNERRIAMFMAALCWLLLAAVVVAHGVYGYDKYG